MNNVGNAPCASESFASPLRLMTGEAPGQDHARVHGGSIQTKGLPAGIGAGHAQQNASIAQSALDKPPRFTTPVNVRDMLSRVLA